MKTVARIVRWIVMLGGSIGLGWLAKKTPAVGVSIAAVVGTWVGVFVCDVSSALWRVWRER